MRQTRISDVMEIMRMREMFSKKEKEFFLRFFKKIIISKGLKGKIKFICDAVREVFGSNYEWIGYLLGDENYIVRDIFLPYQLISKAFVKEDENNVGINLVELEKKINKSGYKLIGWIHSHGDMSPFHSGIDDRNTFSLVRFIGFHAKKPILKIDDNPKRINRFTYDDGDLILMGEKTFIRVKLDVPIDLIRLLLNKRFLERGKERESLAKIFALLFNYSDWWFFERKWIAPVYSVVTNAKLEFYGEIWLYDSDRDPRRVRKGKIVEVIREPNNNEVVDYSEIRRIVLERMRVNDRGSFNAFSKIR